MTRLISGSVVTYDNKFRPVCYLLDDTGLPIAGKTVKWSLYNVSANTWWNGSTFGAYSEFTLTDRGYGIYVTTSALDIDLLNGSDYLLIYKEATIPAYGMENIRTSNLWNILDDIKAKTDLITTGLATQALLTTVSSKVDIIDQNVDDIKAKMPTNYVMGSSDQDSHDIDIDSILVDTNEIQGKLPTNNIMGSSDKDSHDGSIDNIEGSVNNIVKVSIGEIGLVVADGLNTFTTFKTNLAGGVIDIYKDQTIVVDIAGRKIARRVSAWNDTTKFITVSSGFPAIPSAGSDAIIASIFTAAGTSMTEATIASAMWDESMAVHVAGGTSGAYQNRIPEVETDTQNIQSRVPATLVSGRMRSHTEAQDNLPLTAQQKLDVNTEVDGALNTAIPGSPVADSVNERVKALDDNYTVARALKIDFLDQGLVGMEADIRGIDADTLRTLSQQLDLVYGKVIVLPTDPADESLLEAAIIAARDSIKGTPPVDNQTLYQSISQVQNNVKTSISVPAKLLKPETGSKTYRFNIANYDSIGNMEDFDSNPNCKIDQLDGTPVLPWTATVRDSVGMYHIDIVIQSTDLNMVVTASFEMIEAGVTRYRSLPSEVTDIDSQLSVIEEKVDDILEHTSITIPGQITGIETSINDNVDAAEISINTNVDNTRTILQNEINANQVIIERIGDSKSSIITVPKKILIPTSTTKISNETVPITAIQTEIPVFNVDIFPNFGIVKIQDEYIFFGSKDKLASQLTNCVRGFLSSVAVEHADQTKVGEVLVHYFMAKYMDLEGDTMILDPAPNFKLIDENDNIIVDSPISNDPVVGAYVYELIVTPDTTFMNLRWIFDASFEGMPALRDSGEIKSEFIGTTAGTSSTGGSGGLMNGEFLFDQDGYTDNDGVVHDWPDEYAGYVRDPTNGDRLQDVVVRAFRVLEDGEVARDAHPPYEWQTDLYGNYSGALDKGTYMFEFTRDGHKFFEIQREIEVT